MSALVVNCSSGGQTCKSRKRPGFVSAVTNAYSRGKLGQFDTSVFKPADDHRALVPAGGSGPRRIGKLSEGVVVAVDVEVATSQIKQGYELSAYFVDW